MWAFRHNLEKTIQAAAVVLSGQPSRTMNYMKLIKLMYIADREALRNNGRPITGDAVVAMKRGPVLSRTLDLIKGTHSQASTWQRFIDKDRYHAVLVNDPGREKLSRYEIDKLNEVRTRHENHDEWDMVELTHGFLEWKRNDPGDSAKAIPLSDILEAVGIADREDEIIKEAKADDAITRLLERLPS